jgi:hypothetical protein
MLLASPVFAFSFSFQDSFQIKLDNLSISMSAAQLNTFRNGVEILEQKIGSLTDEERERFINYVAETNKLIDDLIKDPNINIEEQIKNIQEDGLLDSQVQQIIDNFADILRNEGIENPKALNIAKTVTAEKFSNLAKTD